MKSSYASKWTLTLLLLILNLILWLIFLPGDSAQADLPPPPPSTPAWERLSLPYPPERALPPPAPWSVQGTLKTFQAVADAEVRQGHPAENYGITSTMSAGYDDYTPEKRLIQRALLRFDVSTFLPPGTTVHQATARLYMVGYCDTGSRTFQAYRIAENWSELTTTWNSQPSFAEGYGSTTIPIGPTTFGWYSFDVTALVQAWVNGDYPEDGIMIRGPESAQRCAFREFLTKGGGGYTAAPQLAVDYTAPAPALAVSDNDLVFFHQCGAGAPAPAPQVIAIQSNDTLLSDWVANVTGGDGWLYLNKTSGQVSHLFPDQIRLSANETTPCPATVTATIEINAAGLEYSPQTISVSLRQEVEPVQWVYLPLVAGNAHMNPGSGSTDRIALLVSVADYYYLDPPTTFSVVRSGVWGDDLLAPRSDSFAMMQSFQSDYGTIVTLPEEYATQANVYHALEWIDEREDAATEVLIYFSTHGGQIGDQPPVDEGDDWDELLGVYDTNDVPQFVNHILDDDLKVRLSSLETEHLAMVFDACSSGGMEVANPYRAVLAASQEDQASVESSELEHGVFTYYMLLAMLDPASDINGDGWLSVQETYEYARIPVADYVRNNPPPGQGPIEQDLALDLTRDFNVVRIVPAGD